MTPAISILTRRSACELSVPRGARPAEGRQVRRATKSLHPTPPPGCWICCHDPPRPPAPSHPGASARCFWGPGIWGSAGFPRPEALFARAGSRLWGNRRQALHSCLLTQSTAELWECGLGGQSHSLIGCVPLQEPPHAGAPHRLWAAVLCLCSVVQWWLSLFSRATTVVY